MESILDTTCFTENHDLEELASDVRWTKKEF